MLTVLTPPSSSHSQDGARRLIYQLSCLHRDISRLMGVEDCHHIVRQHRNKEDEAILPSVTKSVVSLVWCGNSRGSMSTYAMASSAIELTMIWKITETLAKNEKDAKPRERRIYGRNSAGCAIRKRTSSRSVVGQNDVSHCANQNSETGNRGITAFALMA